MLEVDVAPTPARFWVSDEQSVHQRFSGLVEEDGETNLSVYW